MNTHVASAQFRITFISHWSIHFRKVKIDLQSLWKPKCHDLSTRRSCYIRFKVLLNQFVTNLFMKNNSSSNILNAYYVNFLPFSISSIGKRRNWSEFKIRDAICHIYWSYHSNNVQVNALMYSMFNGWKRIRLHDCIHSLFSVFYPLHVQCSLANVMWKHNELLPYPHRQTIVSKQRFSLKKMDFNHTTLQ